MSPLGLPTVTLPDPATVSLTKVYDALVVGSGAAGGMAAHALTSHGLDVLLLEAGKQVDFEAEVRSLEWPYDHPRRGKLAPDTYVLNEQDYKRLKPPYAQTLGRYTNVMSWQQLGEGPDYTKQFFVNEKDHPYTGTNFSWVRSRVLGGKTNVWGRLSLRLSDYDFKAASRDGYGVDWPIGYADVAPYYDKVDHSFVTIKWWVAEAYYTSKIGIHDELKYQGNVYIDDFVGTDVSAAVAEQKK